MKKYIVIGLAVLLAGCSYFVATDPCDEPKGIKKITCKFKRK